MWRCSLVILLVFVLAGCGAPSKKPAPVRGPAIHPTAPAIGSDPAQGQTLTTTNGTWTNSPTSFAYQWKDCDAGGGSCTNITGANASTYLLTSGDVGFTIRVTVTATNAGGSTPATSAQTTVVTALLYGSQGGPYSSTTGIWPGGNWQPYGSSSYWNTQLPAFGSAILYNGGAGNTSADIISYMQANWALNFTSWTFSNTLATDEPSAWNHPLYFAKSTDPTYTLGADNCTQPHATFCPTKLNIPNGARHATGGDAHLTVVEPAGYYSTGGTDPQGRPAGEVDEVDFFSVSTANPISGGGALAAGYKGAFNFDGSGGYGNATATNTGLQGGTVRAQELAAGVINHALAVSAKCNTGNVAPSNATGTGHPCSTFVPPGPGPADGARLQLKLTDATINAMSVPAIEKIYLKAAAHYGIFVTDTGGSPMDPKFEPAADYVPFGNTSNTVMSWLETPAGGSFTDPYTLTISLPWSDFQVVDTCYSTTPPTC